MRSGGLYDAASFPRPARAAGEQVGANRGVIIGATKLPSGSRARMWAMVASVAATDSSGEASL